MPEGRSQAPRTKTLVSEVFHSVTSFKTVKVNEVGLTPSVSDRGSALSLR